jgi:UDP-N-acetylmuramoyl-L-alanyl-D-glutamate--2,6-diaminopimelate ligase
VFSKILANFYSHPEKSFKLVVGVTGTNGKTSTTVMLKKIYEKAGYKVGLIGTMKYLIGEREYNAESRGNLLTTPDPENFWSLLDVMREEKVDVLVMECSSHSLEMDKLGDLEFNVGIFTNLTRDHLDFHGDFDSYRNAKAKLFKKSRISLINDDDPSADELKKSAVGECYTYSIDNINSSFNAKNVRLNGADGVDYVFLAKELIFRVFLSTIIPARESVLCKTYKRI